MKRVQPHRDSPESSSGTNCSPRVRKEVKTVISNEEFFSIPGMEGLKKGLRDG